MDGSRFDGFVRALATGATRRRALRGVAGSAFAGLLGHLGIEEAAAACVKPGKKGCQGPRHRKCCTGARCQGGTKDKVGKCVCSGSHKQCDTTCVNTKKDRKHCGSCNNRCPGALICEGGECVSVLGCRAGDQYCNQSDPPNQPKCPHTTNPNCHCITDVEGNQRCSDFATGFCKACTTNADCGSGNVCFDANGPLCICASTACAAATCDGIRGSGAGRRPAGVSLLR